MFIELTDHLRCPEDHPEQFLVLLPDQMSGRRVVSGSLGCPVCGKVTSLVDGIADFGGGTPAMRDSALSADGVAAFLGLSGPGGYLALAGVASSLAKQMALQLPGIRIVLLNPPADAVDTDTASVLRALRSPLKSGSMRGVVLGPEPAADPASVSDAVRAVLPGLRIVVEGSAAPPDGMEVLGHMAGCWVGRKPG